ncbi:MAG: hypothetical protein AAFO29_01915 [Actinomycetota bacterium]
MRVVVFDDDLLARAGAREVLGAEPSMEVIEAFSLRRGLELPVGYLASFDCAVVDLHDRFRARWEVGTDVYTGLEIIERIRGSGAPVRVVAITPSLGDPLLTERLVGWRVDQVHERWEFRRSGDLRSAILRPDPDRRPVRHPAWVRIEEGLGHQADPNLAMAYYKASPLYGRVRPAATQATIGSRRAAVTLRDQIIGTGFVGSGHRPRWNEVRDYLLKLAGRLPVEPRPAPVEAWSISVIGQALN